MYIIIAEREALNEGSILMMYVCTCPSQSGMSLIDMHAHSWASRIRLGVRLLCTHAYSTKVTMPVLITYMYMYMYVVLKYGSEKNTSYVPRLSKAGRLTTCSLTLMHAGAGG